jgi:hypothetical protein
MLKVVGNEKLGGSGIWLLRTVAKDVCLIFNVTVVCSLKYFRFLIVKLKKA